MPGLMVRAATEQDFPAIRRLIRLVRINPMSLAWYRFVVAVDESGKLLGCGQLKPHGNDLIELASIAVEPGYRNRGIASPLIDQLIARAPRPLYLICQQRLGSFYRKWGFQRLAPDAMPPYFRRISRIASLFETIAGPGVGLLVMELK